MKHISARPWPEGELSEAWQRLTRDGGKAMMPKLLGYIAERRRHRERWVGALLQAGVPLALINGVDDPISGRSIVARWRELLPAATVFELDGVGHYPQVEAPDDVVAAYLSFAVRG